MHLFLSPPHLDFLLLDLAFFFFLDSSELLLASKLSINRALGFLVALIIRVKQGSGVVVFVIDLLEETVLAAALLFLLDGVLDFARHHQLAFVRNQLSLLT